MENKILEQVLDYKRKFGWNCIPMSVDKVPLIDWKEYQNKFASDDELKLWFSNPKANIGILTGKLSNLTVVDIDPRHGGTNEPFKTINTVKSITGGGGEHEYFLYEERIQNFTGIKPGIDIKSEGGIIIAPWSLHKSGNRYEWLNSPYTTKVAPLPDSVRDWIKEATKENISKWDSSILRGVEHGNRNNAAASIIGKVLTLYKDPKEWDTEAWSLISTWNSRNPEPLSNSELERTFKSIVKTHLNNIKTEEEEDKRSVSEKIVDLTMQYAANIYLDQTGEPYITFVDKPIVGFPINSQTYKQYISGLYWLEYEKGFSVENFNQAVSTLEGRAYAEDEKIPMFNRIARRENTIYFDMGDDKQVVKIEPGHWEIARSSPVYFRRFRHQQPQVIPQKGGDIKNILKYVNLKTDTDKLLFLTYLITVFIPDIPRVVLVCTGDQGSAKSTALRLIRSLVDPSLTELLSPPTDSNELALAANHHYCLYLDNLTYLKDDLSDSICRLATGIGFSKRKLYTDSDDVLFTQKVAIGITGINLVAQKADLLDRCLILNYERIADADRKDEEEFWNDFNKDKPYILGAIFDKISELLKAAPGFKLDKKPRMADYAKFGALSAITLGYSSQAFLEAFSTNIERQNNAAIESSPTAQTILKFMQDKVSWTGFSSDLHRQLKTIAEDNNLNIGGSEGFPKSSNWLWKKIMQIRPNLLSLGIKALKSETLNGTEITLQNLNLTLPDMAAMAADNKAPGSLQVTSKEPTNHQVAENGQLDLNELFKEEINL